MNSMTVKTPWHLWAVGMLSLLWNGFGAYDFIMTSTQGETYMRSMKFSQEMIDYYMAMPDWMWVPWILGVWGAVIGSILLLLRLRGFFELPLADLCDSLDLLLNFLDCPPAR